MADLIHSFTAGRMNKDLDERLVPNGEYRDALNLQVSTSLSSQVGTFQNIKGNLEKNNQTYNSSTRLFSQWSTGYISELQNPACIGSIADEVNETIYWFIASDTVSVIASYNTLTDIVAPVIVDTNNILNFSPDFIITGINILEGLLIWTDNQTEPKSIKVSDWVNSTSDFVTHSQIFNRPFVESDITVIRKKPLSALTVEASASGRGGVGTGISPVSTSIDSTYRNFTITTGPNPEDYESLPPYAEDAILGSITINTTPAPANYRVGDLLSLTTQTVDALGDTTDLGVTLLVVGPLDSNGVLLPGNTLECRIQSISSNIPREPELLVWEVLLVEDSVLFEYIFPRFSYRWKYNNNQLSPFAPFTNPVFVGDQFEYLSSDGYNIGMINNARKIVLSNIGWGDESVKEVEILYKASNSTNVYIVDNITDRNITDFTISNEVVGAVVNTNQLLRPYDNVPVLAKAQEITANRLIYANYSQQYDLQEPKVTATFQVNTHPGAYDPQQDPPVANPLERTPISSLKSIRTYQIGACYLDEYGRETPVFTTNNASFFIPVSDASKTTKIQASLSGSVVPDFATHFKYFVKETSNEYYNLALDRFYFAEDGNIWLSFPSSERNKVAEDSYLILKKQHDNNIPVSIKARFKILAIENEAPAFIATTSISIAESIVTALDDSRPGLNVIQFIFNGPNVSTNTAFNQGFSAANVIQISTNSGVTLEYNISSGGPTGVGDEYKVTLQKPLGTDAAFLDSLTSGSLFTITIKEKVVERKPEYEGRFFAKINRDANFDNYVISSFAGFEPTYGIINSTDIYNAIPNTGPGDDRQDPGWTDPNSTNNWSDKIRRPVANQTWFGVGYAGYSGGESSPVSSDFPSIPLIDDYLTSSNTKIRFVDSSGNRSAVYIIVGNQVFYDRRGFNGISGPRRTNSNARKSVRCELDRPFEAGFVATGIEVVQEVRTDSNDILSSNNPAIFETEPKEAIDIDIYYQASNAIEISNYDSQIVLDWFNCYSYGNGVESNRIRDDFNAPTIDKGPVVSAPLDIPYQREIKTNSLIFSQIFNSISGVNNLNQFIQAEAITKDILPEYGSIQKLRSRDTNLVVLCENKCLRILSDKDALYNADGSTNITSNSSVLGQALPFAGEFGISTNPESFAEYGYRMYFTDKARNSVIRLSQDGITQISVKGLDRFFSDNLRLNNTIVGSFDVFAKEYNVTLGNLTPYWQQVLGVGEFDRLSKDPLCDTFLNELPTTETTLSFKEEVDGWTSRKSYIPESGVSLNGTYYTFKNGLIWQHYINSIRNNFYGIGQTDAALGKYHESSFNVLINENPIAVKTFNTLNYTGSDSLEYVYNTAATGSRNLSIAEIQADNLLPDSFTTKKGWYTNSIVTDLQEGKIKEFIDKEGKKLNYIKGMNTFFTTNCNNNVDTSEFNIQGIGRPILISGEVEVKDFTVRVYVDNIC